MKALILVFQKKRLRVVNLFLNSKSAYMTSHFICQIFMIENQFKSRQEFFEGTVDLLTKKKIFF